MFESLDNGVVTLQPKIINHPSLHLAAVEPLPPSLATASTLCSLKCIRICVSFSPWRGGSDSDLVVYFGVLVMSGRGAGVIPVGSFLLEDSFIPPGGPFERLLQPSRGVQPPPRPHQLCLCWGGHRCFRSGKEHHQLVTPVHLGPGRALPGPGPARGGVLVGGAGLPEASAPAFLVPCLGVTLVQLAQPGPRAPTFPGLTPRAVAACGRNAVPEAAPPPGDSSPPA